MNAPARSSLDKIITKNCFRSTSTHLEQQILWLIRTSARGILIQKNEKEDPSGIQAIIDGGQHSHLQVSVCDATRMHELNALARMSKLRKRGVINSNDEGGFDKDGEIYLGTSEIFL